jgi:putative ABC transport system permease protein
VRAQASGDEGFRLTSLIAVDSNRERPRSEYVWAERDAGTLWGDMRGKDEVQVSEPFANKLGVTQQNNLLTLRTGTGDKTVRVVAVFYDYASDAGVLRMRRDLYQRLWNDDKISSVALYLKPNSSISAQSLRQQFAGRDLLISANKELRDNALQIFDRTFAITGALNLLATVVAFIGVLSALMALQIERTRELGMLRANGMTLRQLWRMTLIETGLMGGTAGLLSMPAGLLLAVILVYIINLRSFGWTIRLDLQWTTFAQAMLVAVSSALLAAIYPMLRLGKIAIASAVRQE